MTGERGALRVQRSGWPDMLRAAAGSAEVSVGGFFGSGVGMPRSCSAEALASSGAGVAFGACTAGHVLIRNDSFHLHVLPNLRHVREKCGGDQPVKRQ